MTSLSVKTSIGIRTILYLTDFSEPSEHALHFAVELARQYGASVEVLHVLTPVIPESCPNAIQADEELAAAEMKKIESKIVGIPFAATVTRGMGVWEAIEHAIREYHIDLIVAGTHGRTGIPKLLLGSVAEEVFRRSPVPVLTVGPHVGPSTASTAQLSCVLFASDFSSESKAAAPYAFSLAEENHARLILLHVMQQTEPSAPYEMKRYESGVAEVIEQLRQIAPSKSAIHNLAEVAVEHGDPADRILAAAKERGADLIVLGVRGAVEHVDAATHLDLGVAHRVVAHASCPVLTVRAQRTAFDEEPSYDLRGGAHVTAQQPN